MEKKEVRDIIAAADAFIAAVDEKKNCASNEIKKIEGNNSKWTNDIFLENSSMKIFIFMFIFIGFVLIQDSFFHFPNGIYINFGILASLMLVFCVLDWRVKKLRKPRRIVAIFESKSEKLEEIRTRKENCKEILKIIQDNGTFSLDVVQVKKKTLLGVEYSSCEINSKEETLTTHGKNMGQINSCLGKHVEELDELSNSVKNDLGERMIYI